MRLSEVFVEVRDKDLERVGQVLPRDLDLSAKLRWCSVGEWKLTLPGNHTMVPALLTPGSGLIVRGPRPGGIDVMFSGPTLVPNRKRDIKNPDGTLTFSGVTDEVHLEDALAFPDPSVADPALQTVANDVRTGKAETLMREYVSRNVVPGVAPAGRIRGFRSFLTLSGADAMRGETLTKSPRYQNLLELLQEIAVDATLGFRVVQIGDDLQFQVVEVRDQRDTVRLDINNGTITSEEIQEQGPTVTDAIVLGQGEGALRQVVRRQNAAGEADWGRPIERVFDRRDTDDLGELQTKGDDELALGAGGVSAKIVPTDDVTMRYGYDWIEGDWVTAVVDGIETWNVITESVFLFNKDRVAVGAAIGDVTTFNPADAGKKTQQSIDSRLGYLERAASGPQLLNPPGQVIQFAGAGLPEGWLRCQGQSLLRADYPALFAAIGTAHGAVDGTHFSLPDFRGRVAVGVDTGQTEFDTLGEKGGAKSRLIDHTALPMSVVEYATGSNYYSPITGGNTSQYRARAHANPAESQALMPTMDPYLALHYLIKT